MLARPNYIHLRTVAEASQVPFAILPGQTELADIGQTKASRDVADGLEIPLVEVLLHERVFRPVDQGTARDAVLQIITKLRSD